MLNRFNSFLRKNKGHFGDASTIVFTSIVARCTSLFVFMYVARVVGAVDYGKYQALLVTLSLFSSAVQGSVTIYATKYVASTPRQFSSDVIWTAYAGSAGFGLLTLMAILLSANWLVSTWMNDDSLLTLMILSSPMLLLNPIAGAQAGILAGLAKHRQAAVLVALSPLLSAPFFIALSVLNGVEGTVLALVVQSLISCLVGEVLIFRTGVRPLRSFSVKVIVLRFMEFAKFCTPTSISGLILAPANWYATVLIVALPNGFAEMAIYGISNQWKQAILFIPTSLGSFLISHLSRSSGDEARHRIIFRMAVFVSFLSAMFVAVIICFFSNFIMSQYGSDFRSGWLVLCVASASAAVISVNNMYSRAAASVGRTWLFLGYEVVWALCFVVGCILLSKEYQSLGVAVAGLVAALLQLLFQIVVWRKEIFRNAL